MKIKDSVESVLKVIVCVWHCVSSMQARDLVTIFLRGIRL